MPDRFPANGSHEALVVLEHADVEGLLGFGQGVVGHASGMDGHAALAFPALPGVKEFAALVAADASDAGGGRGERHSTAWTGRYARRLSLPTVSSHWSTSRATPAIAPLLKESRDAQCGDFKGISEQSVER